MKKYQDTNVYEEAMKRYDILFEQLDHCYISVSGGKDSSVMLQLAAKKAREHHKKISVLYIDLEAQYKATIHHIEELITEVSDVLETWYWIALPLSLRNAVSVLQPKWICWEKAAKEIWARPMPNNPYVIHEDNIGEGWSWYQKGMEFEDFVLHFAKWYQKERGGSVAVCIGIRSDESINRFRTIVSQTKRRLKQYGWTTQVKIKGEYAPIYYAYPLYDWRVEDIWIAVAKYHLKYNDIYELMYKDGIPIYEQRLCQPYGDDQRKGLNQFRALEPETWEKVLQRVNGVNFGNIYCKTALTGNGETAKPDALTWEQYAVFLLESLGEYAPELQKHYVAKVRSYLEKLKGDNVEQSNPIVWKKIAKAIEKNDLSMRGLTKIETEKESQKQQDKKKKYAALIHGKSFL